MSTDKQTVSDRIRERAGRPTKADLPSRKPQDVSDNIRRAAGRVVETQQGEQNQ